ncbi:hypothetical protein ACOSQ2_012536 [Xanthoceras sorbifolium]
MFVSRDVKFHESIFPFSSISTPSTSDFVVPNFISETTEMQPITLPCSSNTNPHKSEQTTTSNTHEPISPTPVIPSSIDQSSTNTPDAESLPPLSDPLNIPSETTTIPPPRQSTRLKRPSAWHRDFLMSSQAHQSTSTPSPIPGTRYTLSDFLSYSRFSASHSTFLVSITDHTEPKNYAQAILNPNWRQAMNTELEALQLNNTWSLVPLPIGHKPIG